MTDRTQHQVGTESERLAKAAALAQTAAGLLWEAGAILRSLAPQDSSPWGQTTRRLNYHLCTTSEKARDLSRELDEGLVDARQA